MILTELKKIINEIIDIPMEEIMLDSELYEELDIDSLDMSQIILKLENKYSIEIEDEDFEDLDTVNDMVEYVKKAVA